MKVLNLNEVTVTHLPTGTTASCSSDRLQHRNKSKAMSLLKSRMWAIQHLDQPQHVLASYVLHGDEQYPEDLDQYKRVVVKNHTTKVE